MRVGVIGAGVMGTNHARVLGGLPGVTMVGIVDPLIEHRTRATEHAGCRAFETLDQLIAEGVDAAAIAAPPHLHHEIALACIARNCDSRNYPRKVLRLVRHGMPRPIAGEWSTLIRRHDASENHTT